MKRSVLIGLDNGGIDPRSSHSQSAKKTEAKKPGSRCAISSRALKWVFFQTARFSMYSP
jgi:hypothetical protein